MTRRTWAVAGLFAMILLLGVVAPVFAYGGGVGGGGNFGGGGGGGGGGPVGFPGGGGGIPFPVFFPFFGGGGSLIPILIFIFLLWLSRQNRGGGGIGAPSRPSSVNVVRLEVALLATAKDVPDALHRLVASVNTSTAVGLSQLLQQSALLLLRNQQYWHAVSYQFKKVPFGSAEAQFNSETLEARSKLSYETITNVNGVSQTQVKTAAPADAIAPGDYIVVVLIVATSASLQLRPVHNPEELREQLAEIGAAAGDNLEGVQVIWQPDVVGESLSRDDLIAMYPELAPI